MKLLQVLITFLLLTGSLSVVAQDTSNAKLYLTLIDKQQSAIVKDFVTYNNAITCRPIDKKANHLKTSLLFEVNKSKLTIIALPPFKGDKEFRDSSASIMRAYYDLLNNDYGKIELNELNAEKTYDRMKAFLYDKIAAFEKLKKINAYYDSATTKFINKYIDNNNVVNDKLLQIAEVNAYYNSIYLLFFKSYKQASYLSEAIEKKDGISVEQNKKVLLQNASEALKQLDTLKYFKGDSLLLVACKKILNFYADVSIGKMENVSKYFFQTKEFQKIRSSYDKKPSHSKEEVANYKKDVKQYNKSLKKFNKTIHQLNEKSKIAVKEWNKVIERFFKKHLPDSR